jgi:hypothetical protein
MYLNSSLSSYEEKYLKYKKKYQILKNQLDGTKGTLLNGGDCNPLPGPEDYDIITGDDLFNYHPDERITIQRYCYLVRSLYEWIIVRNHNILPSSQTIITPEERQRLIEAYNLLYQPQPPPPPPPPQNILTRDVLIQLYPNLEQETWLDLSCRQYTAIDPNTFVNLPYLVYLNLSNNLINFLHPNTFNTMPRLQCLNLNYNNLVTIENGTFDNLRMLNELHLSNNELNLIQSNLFNLPNLFKLNLSNNQLTIRGIDINAFNNLPRLTELLLYNNNIVRTHGNNINLHSPLDNLPEACKIYLEDAMTFIGVRDILPRDNLQRDNLPRDNLPRDNLPRDNLPNPNLSKGCFPLPNPEEEDYITTENLLDLCPEKKITIENKCYDLIGLYRWIIIGNNDILPATQSNITPEDRQRLIQAYNALP